MEDHVVEAIVAMHDGGFVTFRNVRRQPFDQAVHRVDAFRARGLYCFDQRATWRSM
jgi:hypothetical protein